MTIPTRCPTCRRESAANDDLRGRVVYCPCGQSLLVGETTLDVPAPPPARKRSPLVAAVAVLGVLGVGGLAVCGGGGVLLAYLLKQSPGPVARTGPDHREPEPQPKLPEKEDGPEEPETDPDRKKPKPPDPEKEKPKPPEPEKPKPPPFGGLDEAVAALQGNDEARAQEACVWLAGQPLDPKRRGAVAAPLMKLASSRKPELAGPALDALVVWTTREHVPALTHLVQYTYERQSPDLAVKAIGILAQSDDEQAVKTLLLVLERDYGDAAARALLKMGPKALPQILPWVNATNDVSRRRARDLVEDMNVEKEALVKRCLQDLKSRYGNTRFAAEYLTRLRPIESLRSEVARALEAHALGGNRETFAVGVEALLDWGDSESVPKLAQALARKGSETSADYLNLGLRLNVIERLGRSKDLRALPGLVARMNAPEDVKEVLKAIQALGPEAEVELRKLADGADTGKKDAAKKALQALPARSPVEVSAALDDAKASDLVRRKAGFQRLAKSPIAAEQRAEVKKAAEAALSEKDRELQALARQVFVAWSVKDDVPEMLEQVKSGTPERRAAAMEALGRLKEETAIVPLVERLSDTRDMHFAEAALISIGPKSEPELLRAMQKGHWTVNMGGVRVLAQIGTTESLPVLRMIEADAKRKQDVYLERGAADAIRRVKERK